MTPRGNITLGWIVSKHVNCEIQISINFPLQIAASERELSEELTDMHRKIEVQLQEMKKKLDKKLHPHNLSI